MRILSLLCALAFVSPPAHAGENKYLGAIVAAAASVNNSTTAAPFVIPPMSKLTVYCTAAVNMLADNTTTAAAGATKGVPVAATTLFPTSVGGKLIVISGQPSALLVIFGTATCDVWLRVGDE